MKQIRFPLMIAFLLGAFALLYAEKKYNDSSASGPGNPNHQQLFEQGRNIFRHDTFGDQDFWGGTLQLHRAIEGAQHGGVGPGVSPATALGVGLKVDQEALPAALVQQIKGGKVNLNDPTVTLA